MSSTSQTHSPARLIALCIGNMERLTDSHAFTYSARLGAISPRQFQAALTRFKLGEFLHAAPIDAGNFGQNVYVTATSGEYVLRGHPFWPHQFSTERYYTNQLHAHTRAPVPWPYRHDPSDDIFGWSYVLMPRMPGIHPYAVEERATLGPQDRREIAYAMGVTLAELQRLTVSHAGRYNAVTGRLQPFPLPHAEWVVATIWQIVLNTAAISDTTTAEDLAWVADIIARNRAVLEVPFVPSFVMQDYKEDNAVAECVAGRWRVAGVFDYPDAYFSDGEMDLARSVAMYYEDDPGLTLARDFVRAYAEHHKLRPGYAGRFEIYALLERVLCWQFGHQHEIWWEPNMTLQAWAGPYVAVDVF